MYFLVNSLLKHMDKLVSLSCGVKLCCRGRLGSGMMNFHVAVIPISIKMWSLSESLALLRQGCEWRA